MEEFIKKMENEALIKSKYKEKLKYLLNNAKKESKGDYISSQIDEIFKAEMRDIKLNELGI